jgi:hypothetical protein
MCRVRKKLRDTHLHRCFAPCRIAARTAAMHEQHLPNAELFASLHPTQRLDLLIHHSYVLQVVARRLRKRSTSCSVVGCHLRLFGATGSGPTRVGVKTVKMAYAYAFLGDTARRGRVCGVTNILTCDAWCRYLFKYIIIGDTGALLLVVRLCNLQQPFCSFKESCCSA